LVKHKDKLGYLPFTFYYTDSWINYDTDLNVCPSVTKTVFSNQILTERKTRRIRLV